jgi:hypothetical protein
MNRSIEAGAQISTTGSHHKKKHKHQLPLVFSKYKFYLDVRASKSKTALIEDINCLGGTLAEFLTREVTHVISECPEWKFSTLNSSKCGPPSPWTPGATPSPVTSIDGDRKQKVRSRVESIVGATKLADSYPSADVLETAKRFKCQIWAFAKTLAWIDKFKAKYRKVNISGGERDRQTHHTPIQRSNNYNLVEPFIKIDSTVRYCKPVFSELKAWPKINLESYAGISPFSEQKKQSARKKLSSRLEPVRNKEDIKKKKDPVKKKVSGFCEICNVNYSEIERHLRGESHTKFVRDLSNWKELDANTDSEVVLLRRNSILF